MTDLPTSTVSERKSGQDSRPILNQTTPHSSSSRDAIFAFLVIGTVFALLTWKTWRSWPDLMIDFGLQLYLPWQISTGAVLYRDVHYLTGGPLSQYYHALLFKIFGVSFLTLIISNLAVLGLLLAVIYRCFYRYADQLTAITACVSVLLVFAFAHYSTMGIFNYITPYSAEVVHGLVLSVVAVALLAHWLETGNPWVAGAAGLCGGLTLLTKPDLFLALSVATGASAVLFWRMKPDGKALAKALALMAGGGLMPAAGFFLWFWRVEDFRESFHSVLAAWIPLLTTSTAKSPFYLWCLGFEEPWVHLQHSLFQFLGLACMIAVCALASWRKIRGWTAGLLAVPMALVVLKVSRDFNWFSCGYCLPPICLALLALLAWRAARTGWAPPVVFASLWMVKLGLFCRIWHYGFALAMPGFLCGLYFLLWALPEQLKHLNVRPALFRGLMWLMLLPGLARLTQASQNMYAHKTMAVGSRADTIMAFDPHYRAKDSDLAAALSWVESNMPPRATMAVLPQGTLLNYLSRHDNPCSYTVWNPTELAAFGQEKMTGAFIASSPDYVIELYVSYADFDEPIFGQKKRFGLEVQQWIDAHYERVCLIGHDWLKDGQFGITILKKNRKEQVLTAMPPARLPDRGIRYDN